MKRIFDILCQFKICLDHFEDILEMIVYSLTAFETINTFFIIQTRADILYTFATMKWFHS